MKVVLKYLFISLFFLMVTISCTIQKRNYQKGYYVSYDKKRSKVIKKKNPDQVNEVKTDKHEESKEMEYIVSTSKADEFFKNYKNKIKQSLEYVEPVVEPTDSCGDTLILINQNEFIVKVVRIDGNKVEYKSCTYVDGPTNVMNLDNIWMIKFLDGRVLSQEKMILKDLERNKCRDFVYFRSGVSERCHVIEESDAFVTYETCDKQEPVKKISKLRVSKILYADPTKNKRVDKAHESHQIFENTVYPKSLKLSLTITFLFLISMALSVITELPLPMVLAGFFYLASIATGLQSLNQILENPEKYKGKYLAYANLAITLLPIAVVLFIGFLFFLLIFPFFYIGGWHN